MENVVSTPPVATAPPIAAPVMPEMAAGANVAAPVTPSTPTNNTSGSINEFIKSTNWIEVGFMILGAFALVYTISYYRYKIKEDKLANNDMQKQIDEVKMNVQSAMKGKYQTM